MNHAALHPAASLTAAGHVHLRDSSRPDRQAVQHRRRPVAEYCAVAQLRSRCQHQPAVPLLDPKFGAIGAAVGPAPYPYQLASALQPPEVVVVVTLAKQSARDSDVVHEDTSPEPRP